MMPRRRADVAIDPVPDRTGRPVATRNRGDDVFSVWIAVTASPGLEAAQDRAGTLRSARGGNERPGLPRHRGRGQGG